MQQEDVCVCVKGLQFGSSLWTRRGRHATIQVEIPTAFKIKSVVLQGDGVGRGSFCPRGGRGQGILTPVQAHEAFQETSLFILLLLMFITTSIGVMSAPFLPYFSQNLVT
jgi:hypothetical protein